MKFILRKKSAMKKLSKLTYKIDDGDKISKVNPISIDQDKVIDNNHSWCRNEYRKIEMTHDHY